MHNILRFWNKGRKSIIIIIAVIALFIVLIRILNQIAKSENQKYAESKVELTEEEEKLPTKSILGEQTVSLEGTKQNTNIIESFVELCNNGEIEKAYNMLTDDCKAALFNNQNIFKQNYFDKLFNEKKTIKISNFLNQEKRFTYLVKFYDDAMAYGKINTSEFKQDYITIDYSTGTAKLSVNNLIYRERINKQTEYKGIKLTVLSREVYKDNEKYQILIENTTEKRIMIDTGERTKTVYAIGNNGVNYNSNISEISSTLYEIPGGMSRNYELKFRVIYSSGIEIKQINFSDIVPDYENYKQTSDKEKERIKLSINI